MFCAATDREAAGHAALEKPTANARAGRRVADARTNARARSAEEVGRVSARIARADVAVEAEEVRVEQVLLKLEAVEPARA